jgi:hypothetical protein
MKAARIVVLVALMVLTFGLVAFVLLFGIPFFAQFPADWVLTHAGCKLGGFDIQASCPKGSYAEPFIPLSNWFTSLFAPYILVVNFGWKLLAWAGACFATGLLWMGLEAYDKRT